jgi:dTDP-4-dehydrorhamnose reductase
MKICIIGASGVIGSKLFQYLSDNGHDVIGTYNSHKLENIRKCVQLDIRDRSLTMNFLEKNNPDIIIHTSAITNVDLCETDQEIAYSVNVNGTKNIVDGCKLINKKIIYISTSYVFDGTKLEYFEDDETKPSTYYGFTKLKGENLIQNSGLSYLILRTDQPYDWKEKEQHTNSVLRVIETLKEDKNLNEIKNWYNTPTYVPDLVLIISKLIKNCSEGIFHVVGPDYINRYFWSLEVAKIFNLDETKIYPIKSEKLQLHAKRTNVNLKNTKILKETGLKIKGVKEGAIAMKNELEKL